MDLEKLCLAEEGTSPRAVQQACPCPPHAPPAASAATAATADKTVSPAGAQHCQGLIRCRSPSRAGHLFGFGPGLDTVSRLAPLPQVTATVCAVLAAVPGWLSSSYGGCNMLSSFHTWPGCKHAGELSFCSLAAPHLLSSCLFAQGR